MKTLIISSSLSKSSKSYILCNEVKKKLSVSGIDVEIIDARNISLYPYHITKSKDMYELEEKISNADNYIIGMGVHNYSVNDSLKIILDNCFKNVEGKFYGIVCSGGSEKSYLSTMQLTQMCMNEWKMIQLPRVIYATGKDIDNNKISSDFLKNWVDLFCKEFIEIGKKLSN